MKKTGLFFALLICSLASHAQEQRLWVFFSDKGPDISCQLNNPESILSPQALQLRKEKGIEIVETDLPVYQEYIEKLKPYASQIMNTSRWLNAAAVNVDPQSAKLIAELDFVSGIRPIGQFKTAEVLTEDEVEEVFPDDEMAMAEEQAFLNYGRAKTQNEMLNIKPLHADGLNGRGVRIAIFDAGFSGVDTIDVFDSIRIDNRIIATYDFVNDQETVYHSHSHGTQVMSTIGAFAPGRMIGTAPGASFVLCRTEDAGIESYQEEHYWVAAMEWVDSIGVDIIHSSLGYTEFDEAEYSYSYEQLDGNTAVTTRAADLAAAKGILVTVSAGNEGREPWRYISVPCDGDSVLCIGSVDKYLKRSVFSSVGPSSDGRIKPDVVAMGSRTITAQPNNRIYGSNGTSFSSPLVAGVVACLKQSHPERSNMDIIQAVRLSGDQYLFPDAEYGYGIPDAVLADSLLGNVEDLSTVVIEMEEKPLRGKIVQAARPKPVDRPQTPIAPRVNLQLADKVLTVEPLEEGVEIQDFSIWKGEQKVVLNPKDVTMKGLQLVIKGKYLLSGDYVLRLTTNKYETESGFSIP